MADLTQIDRKLAAVVRADGVFLRKGTDLIHHLVHHDRGVMPLGQVSTGQIRLQVAINKAALVKRYATGLLNIVQQKVGHTDVGHGIHQQSSRRNTYNLTQS